MSKHDTWVKLKAGHPMTSIEQLFPEGFPMRDPWAMGRSPDGKTALWFIDDDRLTPDQSGEIAKLYAERFGVTIEKVLADSISNGFAIDADWVESMTGGAENYRRTLELADFLEANPEPDPEAYKQFQQQQYRDWIEGDRVPEPMPEKYEDVDPRMKSPELEQAYKEIEFNRLLEQGNYSVLDILTGKAMVEVLNQIDSEHEYSLAKEDDILID